MDGETVDWDSIAGHERVKEYLRRAIAGERISHAYAFVGPKGIGKAMTARVFAMALLCDGPSRPCGECRTCRRVERGVHPDLHWIVPDGKSLRIEQMRALQSALMLKPFEAERKVAVIDDGDLFTTAAQNSLLKVLEEPPGETVIIVIASHPGSLLATIRSRCQVIRMQPLPIAEVARILEGRGVEAGVARLIAAAAEGRLGVALEAAGSDIVSVRDRVAAWVGRLAHPNGLRAVIQIGRELETERERMEQVLDLFLLWLRDLLLLKEGVTGAIANQDAIALLGEQLQRVRSAGILPALREVDEARRRLQGNANFRLTVDAMLIHLQRSLAA